MATSSNSTRTRGRAVIAGFPNTLFDYGASIDMSSEQNSHLVATGRDVVSFVQSQASSLAVHVPVSNQRTLHPISKLGVNETIFTLPKSAEEFWISLLQKVPPQPWIDMEKLLGHLSTSRPLEKPSNSKIWKLARNWLDEAIRCGSENQWDNDISFPSHITDESFWEALRIVGDADAGFGTFPSSLRSKMVSAGAAWMLVSPDVRKVPMCWKLWVSQNNISYAAIVPNMSIPNLTPKRKRTSQEDGHSSPTDSITPRPLHIAQSPFSTPQEVRQSHDPIDDTSMSDVQSEDEPPAQAISFVTVNPVAAQSLDKLRDTVISDPEDDDIWRGVVTTTDVSITTQRALKIHKSNTMRDVKTLIKDAIIDGPIEGRIREIIDDTLKEAGIDTDARLNQTIGTIVIRSTADMTQMIQQLDDRLKHQEALLSSLTATVIKDTNVSSREKDTSKPKIHKNVWS
ncbi:hypothetical protein GGS21DRAFT_522078 [Xylaria nigripes]|nr:hypothetical protein GGS21DRAFT_522078 [Xylaria nigripes]